MVSLIMLQLVPAAAAAGAGQGGCVFAPHDWVATTTLKSISAATPAACCAGCAATAGCEAGILDAAGQCYLKAGLQSSTGCRNCTSCTLRSADSARSFEFGPPRFRLRLSAETLGLQNISVGSADGAFTQGFVMNTMPPPKRTEYALWHMNVTDCGSALPQGTRVTPCLGADCGNVSHAVSADGTRLTLRWAGVPLPPPFTARLDVTATVTQLPSNKPGVSLRGAVALAPGSSGKVCLQNLALPTLEGIPMRSEQTESMFSPDFFGHVGKCGGNCKMDMLQNWDGMAREFNYMPNGNDRAMQWFSFDSNFTTRRLGLYVAAHDAESRLQMAMATGSWPVSRHDCCRHLGCIPSKSASNGVAGRGARRCTGTTSRPTRSSRSAPSPGRCLVRPPPYHHTAPGLWLG